MATLPPELVAEVNQRLFAPFADAYDDPKKTEIAIVFGGRSTSGATARKAGELYHDGHFDHIVVAGGARICDPLVAAALIRDRFEFGTLKDAFIKADAAGYLDRILPERQDILTRAAEADYMRHILLKSGVPENRITIGSRERHANTIVRDVIKQDFASAAVIGYAPYIARLIGTFRHQGEERPLVAKPVNEVFGLNPGNWQDSSLARVIVAEARNTDPDNPNGYIGKYCVVPDWEKEKRKNDSLPVATP